MTGGRGGRRAGPREWAGAGPGCDKRNGFSRRTGRAGRAPPCDPATLPHDAFEHRLCGTGLWAQWSLRPWRRPTLVNTVPTQRQRPSAQPPPPAAAGPTPAHWRHRRDPTPPPVATAQGHSPLRCRTPPQQRGVCSPQKQQPRLCVAQRTCGRLIAASVSPSKSVTTQPAAPHAAAPLRGRLVCSLGAGGSRRRPRRLAGGLGVGRHLGSRLPLLAPSPRRGLGHRRGGGHLRL